MTTIDRPYQKATGTYVALDVIRMMTGCILVIMGIKFGAHPNDLTGIIGNSGFLSLFGVHYIVMFHLVGGILLVLGLVTRIAAIVQLPVLIGAMIMTAQGGFGSIYTSFWFTLAVFIALLAISYYGSGPVSLDESMRNRKRFRH